jgi:hypothetical protein
LSQTGRKSEALQKSVILQYFGNIIIEALVDAKCAYQNIRVSEGRLSEYQIIRGALN